MTPHISAEINEIASTVIMPGDPLRAKYIAEKYLENYKLVSDVRNNYAYTGYYNNKLVTIMSSGMGMGSIGIYSYELFKFYNVENIIRVGSCGAYTDKLNLGDVILVTEALTDSNFAFNQDGSEYKNVISSNYLNNKIDKSIIRGKILSSDVFYKDNENYQELYSKYNCLGVEMESFALLHTAKKLNKNATCLLTVSDNFETNKSLSIEERQTSFDKMILAALNII